MFYYRNDETTKTIYSIISYVERGTAGAKQVACTTAQGKGEGGGEGRLLGPRSLLIRT